MKKITLSLLMLVTILVAIGGVSANVIDCAIDGYCDNDCMLVVDEPEEGNYYDPVTISWHYEGNCNPLEAYIAYQEGSCGFPYDWNEIADNLNPNETTYEWDVSDMEDGHYCIAVNIDQLSGPDAGDTSGLFY